MTGPKRVTVSVSEELHQKVKVKAAKEGKTISDKVRECLERWASSDDPPGEENKDT